MQIEFYQWDWLPGFAGFLDTGGKLEKHPDAKAFCVLNLGSFLASAAVNKEEIAELPYSIAESMMHEVVHAIEKWAGIEFSEERVEALIHKYRVSIGKEAADAEFVMPPQLPGHIAEPKWDEAGRVHDWRNYISETVQSLWSTFTDDQMQALHDQADDAAGKEEWD